MIINSKIVNKSTRNSKMKMSSSAFSNNKKQLYVQYFNLTPNIAAKSIYIPRFTKILTFTAAPFWFILVDALSVFEFSMMLGVYISLFPREDEVHSSPWGHRYTHSVAQSSKRFKPLSVRMLLWQDHFRIRKKHEEGIYCVYGTCNLAK